MSENVIAAIADWSGRLSGTGGPGGVRTLDLMTARQLTIFHTFHPLAYSPYVYTNSGRLLSLKSRTPLPSVTSIFGTFLLQPRDREERPGAGERASLPHFASAVLPSVILTKCKLTQLEAIDPCGPADVYQESSSDSVGYGFGDQQGLEYFPIRVSGGAVRQSSRWQLGPLLPRLQTSALAANSYSSPIVCRS